MENLATKTLQHLFDCIDIAVKHQVKNWVLSPGSRVAPLTLGIVRHHQTEKITVTDERSAAFIALGQAIELLHEKPYHKEISFVGLACTSGSAVYNYAPAVAEAFYQQIPLLVLTADRPAEWIGQQDGQAIEQKNIFGKHVKNFFELPTDFSHPDAVWHAERIINEACLSLKSKPYAPIHINIPIREPFYPEKEEVIIPKTKRIWKELKSNLQLSAHQWHEIFDLWESYDRKLVVAGQNFFDKELQNILQKLYHDFPLPIVADSLANLPSLDFIHHHDIFLGNLSTENKEKLRPEILVTFGKSLISKSLKLFLKKFPPKYHLHIQAQGEIADTFQSITHIVRVEPIDFWKKLYEDWDFKTMLERDEEGEKEDFTLAWEHYEHLTDKKINRFFAELQPFSEFEAVGEILENLPKNTNLHVGNSMPIRYVNFFGIPHKEVNVFCNRGTSGIDGSVSTAVGVAMMSPEKTNILIIGDLSFLYDKNGLWHQHLPKNLKIIVLNNFGGNIFSMIDGAKNQPELNTYFHTPHTQTMEKIASVFGAKYHVAHDKHTLQASLSVILEQNNETQLLEILTDREINTQIWDKFKTYSI
ncbi:MAG: 2-succinyl-5-enolpyruvyl-6-hydroxy-3-cyclohexene-1-carboxylic-acid synthase [Bacteroidetes bacterium]|nr:MAG: 2-succinyl-5-enolpyruvyl-6-hydroxy-3-cyclohexene-1-carboxylic-acid synthase [Bacteroidota bacterium]TAG94167.1 MAG: 2-succinyl-5-enolpyruvyl-6-hydroxy-3-cyclohexene-1-carboxylic-acid synthase [Bacteroidota bacterium]